MIPPGFLPPLRTICESLQDRRVAWALTGSLGMVLQGMDLTVHDIDIQTDEDGAYEIERRLAEFVVKPVLYKGSERMRSRLGKLQINGIPVEIIGAVQKRLADGNWEPPVDIAEHRHWLELEGLSIPVLSLEYEHDAYKLMGRDDRAAQIRRYLDGKADLQTHR